MQEILAALQEPVIGVVVAVIFGALFGSFGNVVIHRLPKMMEREWHAQCAELNGNAPEPSPRYNLMVPASACPTCARAIKASENIPIVSWLALGGKCKGCKAPISPRYPIVELVAAILAGAAVYKFGWNAKGCAAFVLLYALLVLTFIDADTQLLPDQITLPLVWLGLIVNYFGLFVDLPTALWGAVAGYLVLWVVYWVFKLVTGKEGMGYGDFKLLAAIGAWLGWQVLPSVILLSSVAGAAWGIFSILRGAMQRGSAMPFGPYLAAGGVAALFFSGALMRLFLPH
jgi:leader peptidase (prepilin peptidase) / N-methyltransferase